MRFGIMVIGILFFASTASAQEGMSKAEQAKFEKMALTAGKAVVARTLKDPEAARFRNLKARKGGVYLCGEVNGKNSYGGYNGYKRFYSVWAAGHVGIEGEEGFIPDVYTETCM